MIIRTLFIDDSKKDLEKFIKYGGFTKPNNDEALPYQKKIQFNDIDYTINLEVKKFEGQDDALKRLSNKHERPIDLLFCDVSMTGKEGANRDGFELVQQLEEHYQGKIPFGIVFVSRYDGIHAFNMLAELFLPTTLCGFMKKWESFFHNEYINFSTQLEKMLGNFINNFTYQRVIFEERLQPNPTDFKWYFNKYIRDYLNEEIYLSFWNEQGDIVSTSIQLKNIVAFANEQENLSDEDKAKIEEIKRNSNIKINIIQARCMFVYEQTEAGIVRHKIDHEFNDLVTWLNPLTRGNMKQTRTTDWFFARLNSKVIVNLHGRYFTTGRQRINNNGNLVGANGAATVLTSIANCNRANLQWQSFSDDPSFSAKINSYFDR